MTTDLLTHSVTRNDHPQNGNGTGALGSVWNIMIAPTAAFSTAPGLPAYWSRGRDAVLSMTPHMEGMWAGAVYKAKTKLTALGWEVSDTNESQTRVRRAQQLLLHFDGKRYVPGFSKVVDDFILTDNGAFVEVVRASKAVGSRILGLMHLDSLRCWRTGDTERPVIYADMQGREHILKAHQVLDFADEPSARVELRGVGRCGATRAFLAIIKLAAVETYFREKITGDRNLAIHIVNGITEQQMRDAIATGREDNTRRGYVYYKGSLVIPAIKMDADLSVVTIPLAEVPDGFDVEQERKDAYLRYANAIGIPVQDVQPLSGQGLGTGTQTLILAEESEGQGLAAFRKDWEHALNEYVFPESTTFSWSNAHDLRDQKAEAEIAKTRAEERATRINSGEIDPAMARQIAVDDGDLDRELVADVTDGGQLSDDAKPVDEAVNPVAAARFTLPSAPVAGPRGGKLAAQKDIDPYQDLIDWVVRQPNLREALQLARAHLAAKEAETHARWTPQLAAAVEAGVMSEETADGLMQGHL